MGMCIGEIGWFRAVVEIALKLICLESGSTYSQFSHIAFYPLPKQEVLEKIQDQAILRPSVSRPVRLGVGPPLEQMTRPYISLSGNYYISSS
jgi:hypothetical protein